MNSSEVQAAYSKFVVGNYTRAPIAIVRGAGSRVWDADGKRYLDLLPGLGVNGLGHCPPRVVAAIQKQAAALLHIHNNFFWEQQARLGQALSEKLNPDRTAGVSPAAPRAGGTPAVRNMGDVRSFFCNSGTEASEAAIKLARLYGVGQASQVAPAGRDAGPTTKKWKLISVENGFHGRTYAALSATAQPKLQKGCEPLLPGFSHVPLNDVAALEKAFDAETIGFMVEPVQGEGGIFICTKEYLEAARELCDRHGALLMYDEVQCGMGRTGDYFAWQSLRAPAPDVLWLAKALGGGFPIGAMVARQEIAQAMVPGTHGTTFGGNPLACAAALAVIETIDAENLIEHVRAMSRHLAAGLAGLRERHSTKIKAIRQLGLMAGIDLNFPGKQVHARCLELGLMINVTHDTTLRLLPAMNVSAAELDEGFEIVSRVLGEQ